jgi:hypothetical protein
MNSTLMHGSTNITFRFMYINLHFRGMCGVYLPTVMENRNNFLAGSKKQSIVFPTSLDAASDKGHPMISEVSLRV